MIFLTIDCLKHLQQGLPQSGSLIQPMQSTKEYLEKALESLRDIEEEVVTTSTRLS